MTKPKARTTRPPRPPPHAYAALPEGRVPAAAPVSPTISAAPSSPRPAPSPNDIENALQRFQPEALAAKGVSRVPETWSDACKGLARDIGRIIRRAVELFGEALVAVAWPLLTAAVDGIAVLVFVLTIYELWTPAKAIADALAARLMG